MRTVEHILLASIFIMMAVIVAGCSSIPFSGTPQNSTHDKIDVGFSSVTVSPEHETFSFGEATGRLSNIVFDESNNITANASTDRQILYIRGMHIDETGLADSWMFVVRHGNQTSIVTYGNHGETITEENAGFRALPIPMNRIISPGELFNRSRAIIAGTQQDSLPKPMELELQGTNYTLTISGKDRTSIQVFDATTGALIYSNE